MAMELPLEPIIANFLLSFYESKWLEQCPREFKPVFYRKYVLDVFVLFESAEHFSKFHAFLNPNLGRWVEG